MMQKIDELAISLQELRLPIFAKQYAAIAKACEVESRSHVEFLKELVNLEIEERYNKLIARLFKQSKLPRTKDLKDFDYTRIPKLSKSQIDELAEGGFIDHCQNILIFGNPGTGKTHLSIALARKWCMAGRKVLFTTAAELIQELLKAKNNTKLNELVKKINRFDVLIIDDISYIACDRSETDVLFLLLASRYESKSMLITSNLQFAKWNTIFKDEMTTTAAIDRLIHHSIILELNTDSYRKESAKSNAKISKQSK